jgi:hypothetical protein
MTRDDAGAGRMRVVRSRGMLSGLLLVLLGLWGALIPFIGPYFSFAYTPDQPWTWTWGRLWFEVLPGVAAILAGLLLIGTAHRAVGVFAGWLGSLAGAWFIVGPLLSQAFSGQAGNTGVPVGGPAKQALEQIAFFYGLGAVILFLAAQALGRFTVRSVRDVAAARAERERTVAAEPAQTRPVAPPAAAPVAETQRPRTTTAAGTERERGAEFDGNRVAPAAERPAVERETAPVSGEGATRVGTPRTP